MKMELEKKDRELKEARRLIEEIKKNLEKALKENYRETHLS
jgi:hypothetical protein